LISLESLSKVKQIEASFERAKHYSPHARHVKTLYRVIGLAPVVVKMLDSAIPRINHNTADNYLGNPLGVVI